MKQQLKIETDNFMPKYHTKESAGLDLHCNNENDIIIKPHESCKIHTGLKLEIPEGYFGLIVPRSSTGTKLNLMLENSCGIIDSDYRGEVVMFMYNYGNSDVEIKRGDRLCQLILVPYLKADIVKVKKLSNTERGESGFGSTGRQ